jgi:hypothetical protein
MAPFWVQTKADTSTAFLWASCTGLPLMMAAQKEPVKESPSLTFFHHHSAQVQLRLILFLFHFVLSLNGY